MPRKEWSNDVVTSGCQVLTQTADLGRRPGKAVEEQAAPLAATKPKGLKLARLGGGAPDPIDSGYGHSTWSLTVDASSAARTRLYASARRRGCPRVG